MIRLISKKCIVASFAFGSLVMTAASYGNTTYEIPLSEPQILGFTFLKSTFSDIAEKLGDAEEYRDSKVEEAPKKACYWAAGAGDSTELIFESDFNGGWNHITGYELIANHREKTSTCTKTSAVSSALRVMNNRLALGMTKQEVLASIGKPRIRNQGNWDKSNLPRSSDPDRWIYLVTGSIEGADDESTGGEKTHEFDVWTELELQFSSSMLISIHLKHGKTY